VYFPRPTAQKPACCITSCTWIPFQPIQNHLLDVSRSIVVVGKEWLGSFVRCDIWGLRLDLFIRLSLIDQYPRWVGVHL
jgi:hypothetical protein